MDFAIHNNSEKNRYEVDLGEDGNAILEYQWRGKDLALMHTFVPRKFEGHGIAAALAKHSLEDARANGYKVHVYCPYVTAWLKRHPGEYNDVVIARSSG